MRRLSAFSLKCAALLAMTVDHAGLLLVPEALWMRFIGRIAMPIFSFLLAESYRKTRDRPRFLRRLLLFALLAQIPFSLAIGGHLNVLFTMALALLGLMAVDGTVTGAWASALLVAIFFLSLFCDWQFYGLLFVFAFYLAKGAPWRQVLFFSAAAAVYLAAGVYSEGLSGLYPRAGVFLALPLLLCYSGARGRDLRYLFYLYYPLHLLAFYALSRAHF